MKWKSVVVISAGALVGTLLGSSRPAVAQQMQPHSKTTNSPAEKSKGAARSGCALLPISLLEKTFGEKFDDEPLVTPMPPAYEGAWGTTCRFSPKPPFTKEHPTTVDFIVFVESSPTVAREEFEKAAVFLADKSKPKLSIGDAAYWRIHEDKDPAAIGVLKDKVHFDISFEPANESQLKDLATAVAAQL